MVQPLGGEATVNAYAKVNSAYKTTSYWILASLDDYHLDDKNRLFACDSLLWMVLAMNFILNYFIGIAPMGNCSFAWPQY
jgi:hypothetical protein